MTIEYSQLRRIVLDHLRAHPGSQVNLVGNNFARSEAQRRGLAYGETDDTRVLDVFHDLYREGVIASGTGARSSNVALEWPHYRVTEYGHRVLSQRDYVPHDPEGYLKQIHGNIPEIDPTIIRYLEEALGCFKANHLLAAAVMTGCAAEKAMLLLIQAFGNALADSDEKSKYKSVVRKHWMIKRKYDELWKRLQQKLDRLPSELADDLEVTLDRVFDLIRSARNDAGHPTGKTVDRNTVSANFILFPTYCRRMYALLNYFRDNEV